MTLPAKNAKTFSMASARPASVASGVMPAECGDSTTFGNAKNGESAASGSVSKTSRPAPEMRRVRRASIQVCFPHDCAASGIDENRGGPS